MTQEEIMKGLKETISIIKPKLDLNIVTPESRLVNDLTMDSLSMMLMALAIEQKFNISVEVSEPFKTVAQVIDYISSKVN